MEDDEVVEIGDLEIINIIGFDGSTVNGLKVHPNGTHLLYPLGNKVCIQNRLTKTQRFLTGHSNVISALDVSPDGKYVASGQINYMGFKSIAILWDYETGNILARHEIHKVRVASVIFTCNSSYLISLGGRDDSNIVVWDIENNEAICGSIATSCITGDALVLCPTNRRGVCFMSAGENNLRIWRVIPDKRKVSTLDVKFGVIKRHIICMVIDQRDEYAYCGTTTGDIAKARLNFDYDPNILDPVMYPVLIGCYGKIPKKRLPNNDPTERYPQGVTALALLPEELQNRIIVGAGDGTVELVKERINVRENVSGRLRLPSQPHFDMVKSTKIGGGVTSLHILEYYILTGTVNCEVYTIDLRTFEPMLHITCHTDSIFDISFPNNFPEVFATASKHDIRVWSSGSCQELLRICVRNFTCSSVMFSHDGKSIVSGWNDGVIRAFTPQTGRLIYAILNAHNKGVSALRLTSDSKKIISGGVEGEVRIWDIKPSHQSLIGILKEHKAPITSISLTKTDIEAVSSSTDGTCIIWDLVRQIRSQILFANTQFMCACFDPRGVQVITTGTDRKIGYWEVYDGSLIRELEGSNCSAVNTLDISNSGKYFVTAGCDQFVKFWSYNDGVTTHIGTGHAAVITAIKFSPDDHFVVSTSAEGGIFLWKNPFDDAEDDDDEVKSVATTFASSRSSCSIREHAWTKTAKKEENIYTSREGTPRSAHSHASRIGGDAKRECAPCLESEASDQSTILTSRKTVRPESSKASTQTSVRTSEKCTCPGEKGKVSRNGTPKSSASKQESPGSGISRKESPGSNASTKRSPASSASKKGSAAKSCFIK